MEAVTIKHKDVDRITQIYPTRSTIDRFKANGWDVKAAEKAFKDANRVAEEELPTEEIS